MPQLESEDSLVTDQESANQEVGYLYKDKAAVKHTLETNADDFVHELDETSKVLVTQLSEVEKRLEFAHYYKLILGHPLFDTTSSAAQVVQGQIRDFVIGQLNILLNIEQPKVPKDFTDEEITALKYVANKVNKTVEAPKVEAKPTTINPVKEVKTLPKMAPITPRTVEIVKAPKVVPPTPTPPLAHKTEPAVPLEKSLARKTKNPLFPDYSTMDLIIDENPNSILKNHKVHDLINQDGRWFRYAGKTKQGNYALVEIDVDSLEISGIIEDTSKRYKVTENGRGGKHLALIPSKTTTNRVPTPSPQQLEQIVTARAAATSAVVQRPGNPLNAVIQIATAQAAHRAD